MEDLEDLHVDITNKVSSSSSEGGFIQHLTQFNEQTKGEVLNLLQYTLLSIVPVVFLNKSMNSLFPETDEQKGSLEILVELVGQLLYIIFGIFLIDRVITYVPTYSKVCYPELHLHHIVLIFLVIVLSLQTKVGQKATILYERLMKLWNGEEEQVYTQPQQQIQVIQPIQQPVVKQTDNEEYRKLFEGKNVDQMYYKQEPMEQKQPPEQQEPMAANDALGGSFGTAF